MLHITDNVNLNDIYSLHLSFETPYFFKVSFEDWKTSFLNDIDGEGRKLFKELYLKAVCDDNELLGFVQYGKTDFGFDDKGEISGDISYNVIRNLYFKEGRVDAGKMLMDEAVNSFEDDKMLYAFFHYFGMSCFARHGKLFEKHAHIEELLKENGFEIEHENVYFSSVLSGEENAEAVMIPQSLTKGNHQYMDFKIDDTQVGGCEVHYLKGTTAYLRWIYINGDIVGKGIGTKCMSALKQYLYNKGFTRFDTDTALDNTVAQHYYEKTGFTREGVTRSYYRK